MDAPKLFVIHYHEDNPFKCTAEKLKRFGLVRFTKRTDFGILLDPFASLLLSKADMALASREGLVALDISWKNAIERFNNIRWSQSRRRALPFLISSNPTNYGKPYKMSTVEAFASSLYLLGFKDKARELLNKFKWSKAFYSLNVQYLDKYEECLSHEEVVKAEKEIINSLRSGF